MRGPRKTEPVGTDRGSSNRAASRNAKGTVGNMGASKKGGAKDNVRSGATGNKEKSRRITTGGPKNPAEKDKVTKICRTTHDLTGLI